MRLVSDEAWATMTIWQEARGESQQGRVAVAEVIRDRTKRKIMSDGTVPGTCLRAMQFSGWNVRDPNRIPSARLDDMDPVVVACRNAWRTACDGSQVARGATHYFNAKIVNPPWAASMKVVTEIGDHRFLIERPRSVP